MEKTKRQSNFELLRIFAIVLIVLFHIQKKGPQRLLTGDYGYFNQPMIYPRLLILEFGVILGMIGNGVFLLISGYFMNSAADINTGKIAKKLLLQLGFAVVVLIIANSVWIAFFKDDALTLGIVTKGDFNGNW
jgi:peptidoglycan/LPS O-acetylase OafA/YrhL